MEDAGSHAASTIRSSCAQIQRSQSYDHQVVVDAHLAEARRALAPFAAIAGRHFGGDLDRLIAHYRANPDAVIGETGALESPFLR